MTAVENSTITTRSKLEQHLHCAHRLFLQLNTGVCCDLQVPLYPAVFIRGSSSAWFAVWSLGPVHCELWTMAAGRQRSISLATSSTHAEGPESHTAVWVTNSQQAFHGHVLAGTSDKQLIMVKWTSHPTVQTGTWTETRSWVTFGFH